MSDSTLITLRINKHLLAKLDDLVDQMGGNPAVSTSGLPSRSDVIRYFLMRGVEGHFGSLDRLEDLVVIAPRRSR